MQVRTQFIGQIVRIDSPFVQMHDVEYNTIMDDVSTQAHIRFMFFLQFGKISRCNKQLKKFMIEYSLF
jgi:hypothetical protein